MESPSSFRLDLDVARVIVGRWQASIDASPSCPRCESMNGAPGYVDEQVFRFNNRRNMDDGQRFTKALGQVVGKRLAWNELTGKETA
jgi:hypothetical protein